MMSAMSVMDVVLVALLVVASSVYVVYSLGTVRLKRRMLEWLIRWAGLRVYNFLSPKLGGCEGCGGVKPKPVLRK